MRGQKPRAKHYARHYAQDYARRWLGNSVVIVRLGPTQQIMRGQKPCAKHYARHYARDYARREITAKMKENLDRQHARIP